MRARRLHVAACAALALLASSACRQEPRDASADAKPPAPAAPPGPSIYELPVRLTDQEGRAAGLDVHRGHPVVVSMFYASCPSACPMLIADIKRLEASLDERTRADVRVLLVSLDPARDTPAALSELAAARDIDLSRWTLASAPEEDVRALAAVLGVQYRSMPDGNINHSSVIVVVARDGSIVHRAEGLQREVETAAGELSRLSRS